MQYSTIGLPIHPYCPMHGYSHVGAPCKLEPNYQEGRRENYTYTYTNPPQNEKSKQIFFRREIEGGKGTEINSKVSVEWQMLFAVIPIVNLWVSYRVDKLRKALIIFILANLIFRFIADYPFSLLYVMIIEIYFIRRWTIQWNER